MPRRPDFEPYQQGERWIVNVPPAMSADGRRHRKSFTSEDAANRFAGKLRASHGSGVRGAMIPATASVHNERAVPETVAKHGGRITGLRAVCRKAISRRSLRFVVEGRDAPRPMLRPGILSHPCKWDVEP